MKAIFFLCNFSITLNFKVEEEKEMDGSMNLENGERDQTILELRKMF